MSFWYKIIRSVVYSFFRICYRFEVIGKENLIDGGAIIAPTHTSFLDPPAIGCAVNEEIFFVARKTLFKKGVIDSFLTYFNTYPITGTNEDRKTIRKVRDRLSEEKKVVVFPEGIRSLDETIQPIKMGIGMLAIRNECPVIPVYINGTFKAWRRGQRCPYPWGKITCVIGSPILCEDYLKQDKKAAQAALKNEIEKSLVELQQWFLNGKKGPLP